MKSTCLWSWLGGAFLFFMSVSCATDKEFNDFVSSEDARIATISEQITAINGTISDLEAAKNEINTYLAALSASLDETDECAKANQIAIADLKARSEELQSKINSLKEYVSTELTKQRDWSTATFATIEQINSLAEIVAGIRSDYDALSASVVELEEKLGKQIADLEEGLKKWVNTQLSEYYTISVMDAKLAVIEKSIQDYDEATKKEIEELKSAIEEQKKDITEAYQKAIEEAISKNNGVIDKKIQDAITEVNERIDTEIAAITEQLTVVFSRLDAIDACLLEIYGLLKKVYPTSISIISSSTVKMGFGRTRTIDFRVNPSDASFNYDVESADCEIELDYLGANTKSGYVTTPTHIALTKVEPMYDANQNKLQGQYRAYITDKRELKKYDDRLGLVLTVPGQSGNKVQISSSAVNVTLSVGEITSFTFKMEDNPLALQEDLVCDIDDDIIRGRIPHFVSDKKMIPQITFEGEGKLILRSNPGKDINSATDFSQTIKYDVVDEETNVVLSSYDVIISAFTGLPIVWIETENCQPVVSKEEYLNASFLMENVSNVVNTAVKIKGRGNATWTSYGDKKPYRLKFGSKVSLFDEPKEKSYVLLANACDKTELRNNTAFYMSKISQLEYTPNFHFVDLFLNREYYGTYQLGDHLNISKNRVNVGDDGFLMEIDVRALEEDDSRYFSIAHLEQPVNIKDPEVEYGDDSFNYCKAYIEAADAALFSDDFKNPETGWQKFIDMDSFIDWYWINELSRNGDAIFYTSCYMNLKRGGKLKMGPVWDFDTAFGNNNTPSTTPADGYYIKGVKWFTRLFEDPVFANTAKERFMFFFNHRDDVYRNIDESASEIKYSVIENQNRWNNLYVENFYAQIIWGAYYNEVQGMKEWLERRFQWFYNELNQ